VQLVEGLVAIFDRVKVSRKPVWVSLEAPAGWGKTRVAQEFFKRISAERQSSPEYWPSTILGPSVGQGEVDDRRKRVFPESFDRAAGAGMDWFWWGISCSLRRGSKPSQAIVEDLHQLEQHASGLEGAFDARAPLREKAREAARQNVGATLEAVGGEALAVVASGIPLLGLLTFLGKWVGGAAKRHLALERERATETRIDATGADRGDVVEETALQIGRLARHGLPVVVFVEDLHYADPGLLDLLFQLMTASGSVMVITTSWPGELAKSDRLRESSLLVSCSPTRRVHIRQEEFDDPTGLLPPGAGMQTLESDALAGIVLHAFPMTSPDVVGLLCEKYRSPLVLEVVCALGCISGFESNGALKLQASDLADIPPVLQELYQLVWKELPVWAKNAYALATVEIPELVSREWGFGDDRFDQRLLKEIFEKAALPARVELTASQLQEALDVYAWTRDVQHGLGGFMEPLQRSIANNHALGQFGKDAINKFLVLIGEHITFPDQSGDLTDAIELHRASLLVGLCKARVIEPNESVLEALLLLGWSFLDTPSGPSEIRRIIEFADSLSQSFPADQPQFLRVRNLSAGEHYAAGRPEQALAIYTELLEDQARLLGPNHPDTLGTQANIGSAHQAMGHLEHALALYAGLLEDQTRLLGPDHPDTLTTRSNIGVAHEAAGHADQALAIYTELLEDQARLLGPNHPDTLGTRSNIGAAHHAAGRLEHALTLYAELLEDQTRLLGPDHPDTLLTRNNIGVAHDDAGRPEQALTHYAELLEAQDLALGPDHPDTLRTRNNIGAAHHAAGRLEHALTLYAELLEDQTRVLGPDHPFTLTTRNSTGLAHDDAGRPNQALTHYDTLLKDQTRLLGPDHPDTLLTRNNIGAAHHAAGRPEHALTLYSELLEDQTRLLGPDHPDTLRTRNNIATTHESAGCPAQAVTLLTGLLEDLTRVLGPDHPYTLGTRGNIASAHEAAGRPDQALTLYASLLADRKRLLGPDHPATLLTRNNIAITYDNSGRHEQALAMYNELLDDQTRVLGPDHADTLTTRKAAQRRTRRRDVEIG
jgi:tetratricopeptide (TPR) repeat protein